MGELEKLELKSQAILSAKLTRRTLESRSQFRLPSPSLSPLVAA
ncbi:hypothetical protein OIU76_006637 [Salix suchowensis]|nr:hypothetical protein OIU78_012822 [Salix suchowensis]KAJ6336801.1 hypothetical protein OIU76_006637 [Salix suchowensis]